MRMKLELEPLVAPGRSGGRVLRLLLAGACRFSCPDCPMNAWRQLGEGRGALERQARAFVAGWRSGACDGLFVTAGIPRSPREGAERILAFLRILRQDLGFRGYVHVKSVAGCSSGQVESLLLLADRLSWTPEPCCSRALDEAPPEAASALRSRLEAAGPFLRAVRRRCEAGPPRTGDGRLGGRDGTRRGEERPAARQLGLFCRPEAAGKAVLARRGFEQAAKKLQPVQPRG